MAIVGAGIVGASIALHLARRGASVQVFDAVAPAAGATGKSFAWVNAFVPDAHYRDLRLRSMAAYRRLDVELELGVIWGGYLNWAADAQQAKEVQENARQLQDCPYPVTWVHADDALSLNPGLAPGPWESGIHSIIDGHLDPVRVTQRFLDAAGRAGAKISYPCAVQDLEIAGGRLRALRTDAGRVEVDPVVLASGVETPRLAALAGYTLPLIHAPGLVAHSQVLPPWSRMIHDAPGGVVFKQKADGAFAAYDADFPPDLPVHEGILHQTLDFPDAQVRRMHGERTLAKVGRFKADGRTPVLDRVSLGFRPMPADRMPVIGALPGCSDVHVAVMHSGVTLAPVVGELLAREILDGQGDEALLAPYRPGRFKAPA